MFFLSNGSNAVYLVVLLICTCLTASINGQGWTETSAPSENWRSITSDSTGQYLAAVVLQGGIYTSVNYGSTWTQTSAATPYAWYSITSDSTGRYLAAVVSGGAIYTSANYGSTWTETSAPSSYAWYSIASDSTGQYLAAVVGGLGGGGIYTSTNYGSTWTQTSAPISYEWQYITSDSTGQYLAAIAVDFGIYTSSNYGSTWTQTSAPTSESWLTITSDSTGKYLAAGCFGPNGIYTSANYGSTWTQTSAPKLDWFSITSDSTGQYLAAIAVDFGIYTSANYGSTWTQTSAPTEILWQAITSDSTGQYLAAVANYDGIFVLRPSPTGQPSSQPSGQRTAQPSGQPTTLPSVQPSSQPSVYPTLQSSLYPTSQPSGQPTTLPSVQPSSQPSVYPTSQPSGYPTLQLSLEPSSQPSVQPSLQPSLEPSSQPSVQPTSQPSGFPTLQPSVYPTLQPSVQPSSLPSSEPSSRPSLHPSSQPSLNPTSQPSRQPSSQPSVQPSSLPSSQPSSQPSLRPTSQISLQPTSQPSLQPSVQPSHYPTGQPTSNPTLISNAFVYAGATSSINSDGVLTATTVLNNIGFGSELYLIVKFLQTGFDSSSFLVNIVINGKTTACQQCSADGLCGNGYVVCCFNQDVTSFLSTANGGQLSIQAISNVAFNSPLCDRSTLPYFQVNYTISKGAPSPTYQPTSNNQPLVVVDNGVSLATKVEAVFVPIVVVLILGAMVVVGTAIHYGRREESQVEQISLFRGVSTFVMFGGGFLSQIFSMLVFFSGEYSLRFGYAWMIFRLLFILLGISSAVWLFSKHSGYQEQLDWKFLAKNKKLYGVVVVFMIFHPNLLSMLPWTKTTVTTITLGYPSLHLFYMTAFLIVVESLTLTAINTAFAINQKHLFEQPAIQQFEFFFSLSFTFLNGVMLLVECLFLVQVEKQDINDRNIGISVDRGVEISDVSNNPIVANRLQSDIETSGSTHLNYQPVSSTVAADVSRLCAVMDQLLVEKKEVATKLNILERERKLNIEQIELLERVFAEREKTNTAKLDSLERINADILEREKTNAEKIESLERDNVKLSEQTASVLQYLKTLEPNK